MDRQRESLATPTIDELLFGIYRGLGEPHCPADDVDRAEQLQRKRFVHDQRPMLAGIQSLVRRERTSTNDRD